MQELPQFLSKAVAGACLLLWAASPAAGQACTPDWGKCGSQGNSLAGCCSPLFTCVHKGDWYWQCVQKEQTPVLPPAAPVTLPPLPPPPTAAPVPQTTQAPATQAPESLALESVKDQVKNLESGAAGNSASEVSHLSDLAAELSTEGKEAEALAVQVEKQVPQAGMQNSGAEFAAEVERLSRLSTELEAKTKQMADMSTDVLKEAQSASQNAGRLSGEAAQIARFAATLPGAGEAVGKSQGQAGHGRQPLSIEVYYSPTGAGSHDFVDKDLRELVGLGLPGSLVNVTLLPAVPRSDGVQECVADVDCSFARAQVCAMQYVLQPAAVDDPALQDFLNFLACDLSKTSLLEEGAPGCAKDEAQASAIQKCSEGGGSKAGMLEAAEKTEGVQQRFKALNLKQLPHKPWVFVGGQLVSCSKGLCSTKGSSEDAVGFKDYVCHKLSPKPKICDDKLEEKRTPAQQPAVKVLPSAPLPSPPPVSAKEVPCPDNADLQDCIGWCNKVAPRSSPTFAGHICSEMGTKELDFGMLPQCKCYDSKMENVLKQCSSSCPDLESSGSASVTKALQAVKTALAPRPGVPIDVVVLYSTHCPACRDFISHGLAQLMHAGLPGPEVNVSLLPMDAGSAMARTQLCAMRQTQLQPMAVDGPSLKKGLDFIVCCDLAAGVSPRSAAKRCAAQTGFDWKSLVQCAEGPDGREMAYAATHATAHVQSMLKGRGFQRPPGIPWVFVQGTLLRCSGALCAHEILPAAPGQLSHGLHEGAKPLVQGGASVGFVEYVCSRLSPQPQACRGAAGSRPAAAEASSAPLACENCFSDLGHPLPWRTGPAPPTSTRALALTAGACAAAACAALLAVALRAGLRRAGPAQDRDGFSALSADARAGAQDNLQAPLADDVEQATAITPR